jgi:hypothetical protein
MRNLAITLQQTTGWADHPAAYDRHQTHPDYALQLLGLAM